MKFFILLCLTIGIFSVSGTGCASEVRTDVRSDASTETPAKPAVTAGEPSRGIPQMLVRGVVKDSRTNKPISDMQIVLRSFAGPKLPKSDIQGRFSVMVPMGLSSIYAVDEDAKYSVDAEIPLEGDTASIDVVIMMNPVVTVPVPGIVVFPESRVTVSSDEKTYIKGRVIDADTGSGVSGLTLVCYQGWCPGNRTDAQGNFSIELSHGKTLLFYFALTDKPVLKEMYNYYHVHASTGYTATIDLSVHTN